MKNKTFHPFLALVALVILVGLACGVSGSPTPTVEPTKPPASDTPTPEPTATPNYAATQAMQATEAAAARRSEIVALLDDLGLSSDNGEVLWIQDDDVVLEMIGGMGDDYQYLPLAEGITASDFVLKIDMRWETNSWPVCGIAFRASEEDFSYADFYSILFLRLSGLPAWAIEYYKRGDYTSTITQTVRYSDALNQESGAVNEIVLHAVENNFTVYINGRRQGRYPDFSNRLQEGSFAVIGTHDGGETTCTFSNGWIWTYK